MDRETFESFLQFFRYDAELPLDVESRGTGREQGLTWETVAFRSTAGQRVVADLYRAGGEWRDRPSLILLHGGSGAGRAAPTTRYMAGLFSRAGFNVLAIDMLHFGDRDTGLLETYSEGEKHERLYNRHATYLEWVTQTVKDVRRSVDLLVQQFGVEPGRVGLAGFSRGAVVATIVAAADTRLAATVMVNGGHFDRRETGHSAAACPANYIGRIAPRPLLMVNGRHDGDMLLETSVAPLFALAGEPKRMILMDTGHQRPTPEAQAEIIAWLHDAIP
ncbi:MAG: alpha/beta fold hydrolase [Longimicrobiales bacterium]|nr:alpha/beta fold hydrolase [Longimicrobiales bacterium]